MKFVTTGTVSNQQLRVLMSRYMSSRDIFKNWLSICLRVSQASIRSKLVTMSTNHIANLQWTTVLDELVCLAKNGFYFITYHVRWQTNINVVPLWTLSRAVCSLTIISLRLFPPANIIGEEALASRGGSWSLGHKTNSRKLANGISIGSHSSPSLCLGIQPGERLRIRQKGGWFKGWQEARAEIKSLNCYIFHLHLLFYGGWGPPNDTGGDSWTFGRPLSSAIPHWCPAACAPKAPTQLPWWIWLVFLLVFLLSLSPPPLTSRFLRATGAAKCSCWAVRNKQFAICGLPSSAPHFLRLVLPRDEPAVNREGGAAAWGEGGRDPDKGWR